MAATRHKVAGVYPEGEQAHAAAEALREAGFGEGAVEVVDHDNWESVLTDPERVGERVKSDIVAASGAGAGVGALSAGVLAAAEVAVVAASPVLAVLAGAGLGAIAGTAYSGVSSSSVREPLFRELVREAVREGNTLVIVRADSEAEALAAQDAISSTASERSFDQFGGRNP